MSGVGAVQASLDGSLHFVSATRLLDAQLMVTELVANAVRHSGRAGEPVSMCVRATRAAMSVGSASPPLDRPLAEAVRSALCATTACEGGWALA